MGDWRDIPPPSVVVSPDIHPQVMAAFGHLPKVRITYAGCSVGESSYTMTFKAQAYFEPRHWVVITGLESDELYESRNRRQRKNPSRTTWGHQRA